MNKRSNQFALGLDFGTEFARVVLIDIFTGETVGSIAHAYDDGVIDQRLPIKDKVPLVDDWALQNPNDYLTAIKKVIPRLLKQNKVKSENVIGIGIDFTSSTILPTKLDGTPLCTINAYRENPHAWVKLWKHHSAQPEADRMNQIAQERKEQFLDRYGRKISAEWLFPKTLEILNDSPEIYHAADKIIEAQDWIVWQLTGIERRSTCGAGYKAFWSKKEGFPKTGFFKALHPKMENVVREKIGTQYYSPGAQAGGLIHKWATFTGLQPGTPVGVSIIDAHSSVLGCGVSEPNEMVLCMGTSTCHLLLSSKEKKVQGICGIVEDGIIPGYFGYEAGQAAVGDIFAWYIKSCMVNHSYRKMQRSEDLYLLLEKQSALISPGESGLLALDWWNGNRSVLVNSNLSGLLIGCTLNTRPHEIYRALMESTAMGTLRIIHAFEKQGIQIKKLHATGGLSERSPLLMQIYADVTGREILVSQAQHVCACGAAILGAVAGWKKTDLHSIQDAVKKITIKKEKIFRPDRKHQSIYLELYKEYCRLHDYFGCGENEVMKRLRDLKALKRKK